MSTEQATEVLNAFVTTDEGDQPAPITVQRLSELLVRTNPGAFVVLEHGDEDERGAYAQTCWDRLEAYTVEYRDSTGHWQTQMRSALDVVQFFRRWLSTEEGFRGAFEWRKLASTLN